MVEQQERDAVKVFQLIDWTNIEELVSEQHGEKLEVRWTKAFVSHMESPHDGGVCEYVFDHELCGIESESVRILLEEGKLASVTCIEIPFNKVLEGNRIAIFPELHVYIPISMIEKSLTGDIIDVREMMGERRGYNDRLVSNENNFFNHKL